MKKLIEFVQRARLQLRWKLLGGFLITNLLLIIAPVLVFWLLFETRQDLKSNNDRIQQVTRLETQQNQLVTAALDYSWSKNIARLNEFNIAQKNLERALEVFKPQPLQQENYITLQKEAASLTKILSQIVSLSDAGSDQEAIDLWRMQGSKQASRTSVLIRELSEQENLLGELSYQETSSRTNEVAGLIAGFIILSLLIALALALILTAAVMNPLRRLRHCLDNLARGDLTEQLYIINNDELGELGQRYNKTVASLKELIVQLYSQSRQLSVATEELNAQARQQVTGSSQQANAVAEVTTITGELNQTAREIARQTAESVQAVNLSLEKAQAVTELADQMAATQEDGRMTVARTINALHNLKNRIERIEQHQFELQEQSASINTIIDLIGGIARQTHLLALNASIEAVGAGSHGSRFSVVAGQIKTLADQSMTATVRVRSILVSLKEAIEQASQSAKDGLTEAEKAVGDAGQSDHTLLVLTSLGQEVKNAADSILEQVAGTVNLATSIEVLTQQQQTASHQIVGKMQQINTVTSQTVNSVKQSEVVTYQVKESAHALELSANSFQLGVTS